MSWLQAIRRPSLKWLYGGALDAHDDMLGFYHGGAGWPGEDAHLAASLYVVPPRN